NDLKHIETIRKDVGMVFHPLPILMNITRVEAKESFLYYREGISPVVADVLERLDGERVAVAAALGVNVPSAKEWLKRSYGARGDSLYACLQDTGAYGTVKAPTDIDTRYVQEDVPTGCVPVSCLGRRAGVKTPVIDSAIQWAGSVYGRNYFEEGRGGAQIDFGGVLNAAEHTRKAG
ncbi:MAG TPA: NAD/NADP octopine/nopaline dehydrogenase family protein, partial [Clostridia bacterium]|nr:NAD/NADP octopine/nopaline dehydrogenase family protein [Clostridia bacterium]